LENLVGTFPRVGKPPTPLTPFFHTLKKFEATNAVGFQGLEKILPVFPRFGKLNGCRLSLLPEIGKTAPILPNLGKKYV